MCGAHRAYWLSTSYCRHCVDRKLTTLNRQPSMSACHPPPDVAFAVLEDDDSQRVLGLNVGVHLNYVDEWNSKKDALHSLFSHYSKLNLSIFGRVETARTYAISKLWFCAMFHTPSGTWLQSLEEMCERFCFGRKDQDTAYQAGKRKLLYLKKENHGYNAMHIPSQWAAIQRR